jgi:hypothetical protein
MFRTIHVFSAVLNLVTFASKLKNAGVILRGQWQHLGQWHPLPLASPEKRQDAIALI